MWLWLWLSAPEGKNMSQKVLIKLFKRWGQKRKLGFWLHGHWNYVKATTRMNPNLFLPLESSGKLACRFLARPSDRRGCRRRPGSPPRACWGSPGRHWRSSSPQRRNASRKLCSAHLKIIQDYPDWPSSKKRFIYSFIHSDSVLDLAIMRVSA